MEAEAVVGVVGEVGGPDTEQATRKGWGLQGMAAAVVGAVAPD